MDKKQWKQQTNKMRAILKSKKDQLEFIKRDIEELTFTIDCYANKIKTLK